MKLQHESEHETIQSLTKEIRHLKRNISGLIHGIENANGDVIGNKNLGTTYLLTLRQTLEASKKRLTELGGTYMPTKQDLRNEATNQKLDHITKLVFSIGGFFYGFETRTITVEGDAIHEEIEHTFNASPSYYTPKDKAPELTKARLIQGLKDLYLGEWKRYYDPTHRGYIVFDGISWNLEIYFEGYKPLKIHGSNDYPCNFAMLLELINIDPWRDEEEEDDFDEETEE